MAKRIALKDYIGVDGHDISSLCRAFTFSSEHEQVDVSGFNSSGADEYLAGKTVQSITIEVFGSYGTGEIHDILYPIHRDRSIVAFEWRPDQSAVVSASNPSLEGNVQVLSYAPGSTRGEAEAFSVTLTAADSSGLAFVES